MQGDAQREISAQAQSSPLCSIDQGEQLDSELAGNAQIVEDQEQPVSPRIHVWLGAGTVHQPRNSAHEILDEARHLRFREPAEILYITEEHGAG